MRFFDAFSGYGGFHLGIERAYESSNANRGKDRGKQEDTPRNEGQGLQPTQRESFGAEERPVSERITDKPYERPLCIGNSEIDKYASAVYKKHFGGKNYGNIKSINAGELPDFDLFVGGFPCQAFSIAGKRRGFDDTRGTLFFDIARILKEKQPRFVLLENVKGLLSHDSGRTFKTIISTLAELGYSVEWQVLNAKNFGVPQNRERVFIIGHLGGFSGRQVFPIRQNGEVSTERQGQVSPAITLRYYKQGQSDPYLVQSDKPSPLKKGDKSNSTNSIRRVSYTDGARIRRLTPTECERLMGPPDGWTKEGILDNKLVSISDTQRHKLCGNGVVVNCVEEIIKRLFINSI